MQIIINFYFPWNHQSENICFLDYLGEIEVNQFVYAIFILEAKFEGDPCESLPLTPPWLGETGSWQIYMPYEDGMEQTVGSLTNLEISGREGLVKEK